MLLPPPPLPGQKLSGEDAAAAVTWADGVVLQAWQISGPFREQAERNLNLFLGHHWRTAAKPGEVRVTCNRIQNHTLAVAAVQNRDAAVAHFVGRETDEPPIYYLDTVADLPETSALRQVMAQMPPETYQVTQGPSGETVYPRQLADAEVMQLKALIQQSDGIRQQVALGQVPQSALDQTIPAEVLIAVNDRTTAAAIQDVADGMIEEANGRAATIENSLLNAINGWQDMSLEWDDETQTPILRNPEFMLVHFDPVGRDVDTASYVALDQYLPLEYGLKKYGSTPQMAEAIQRHAVEGAMTPIGSVGTEVPSVYAETSFRQSMIPIRTIWVRHQPYALTLAEALASGQVQQRQMPVAPPAPGLIARAVGAVKGMLGMGGDDTAGTELSDAAARGQAGGPGSVDQDDLGQAAAMGGGAEPAAPQMQTCYYLGEQDITQACAQGTHTKLPQWPTRRAIRQLRIIASELQDDRECEFVDIPLTRNFNIKYPYRPYGIGEPDRLDGLNTAINGLLSDLATYSKHNAFPAQFATSDIIEANPELAEKRHIEPGRLWKVPANTADEFAKKFGVILPAKLPEDSWQLVKLLLELVEKEGSQVESLQGLAPSGRSGEAIGRLQSAAECVIVFKSLHTEFMLRHIYKLIVGCIQTRCTPEQLRARAGKYPLQAWYAFHDRAKKMAIDISIEITSGSGANDTRKKQSALTARQMQLLSRKTTLERLGEDPKVEAQNLAEERREDQSAQGQVPGAVQQPMPQGMPQNGSGASAVGGPVAMAP